MGECMELDALNIPTAGRVLIVLKGFGEMNLFEKRRFTYFGGSLEEAHAERSSRVSMSFEGCTTSKKIRRSVKDFHKEKLLPKIDFLTELKSSERTFFSRDGFIRIHHPLVN